MRVKVIGTTREGSQFNEVFTLQDGAKGADLRAAVCEKLVETDVELLCMGRMILNSDEVPSGCVMHMRLPALPEDLHKILNVEDPKEDEKSDSTPEMRDLDEAEEILYDDESLDVAEVLGANWNDPEVLAEYRARLEQRGIDAELYKRELEKTMKVIKKYQHYVFFFIVALILELLIAPPLSYRIKDSGNNATDDENLTGFAWFYSQCDYITMVSIWWYLTLAVALLVLLGTCAGSNSERLLKFYKFQQYVFLAFNCYFVIGSGFKLEPFNTMIEKGMWLSMAMTVFLVSFFRLARLQVMKGYWHVYNLLKDEERAFAHSKMNPCAIAQESLVQQQMVQVPMDGMEPPPPGDGSSEDGEDELDP